VCIVSVAREQAQGGERRVGSDKEEEDWEERTQLCEGEREYDSGEYALDPRQRDAGLEALAIPQSWQAKSAPAPARGKGQEDRSRRPSAEEAGRQRGKVVRMSSHHGQWGVYGCFGCGSPGHWKGECPEPRPRGFLEYRRRVRSRKEQGKGNCTRRSVPPYRGKGRCRMSESSHLLSTEARGLTAQEPREKDSYDSGSGAAEAALSQSGCSEQAKLVDEEAPECGGDCILDHRRVGGQCEYPTRWKGCRVEAATWVPKGQFWHGLSSDLGKYAKAHGVGTVQVRQYLRSEPEAVEVPPADWRVPRGNPL